MYMGGCMRDAVVSARIDRELYEKIKRYRINVSQVIRRALEEEIRRREEEEIRRGLEEASKILSKIPEEEVVEIIRSLREER
jgi:antitoxin CcdA